MRLALVAVTLLTLAAPALAQERTALRLGTTAEASITTDAPGRFELRAEAAGVLLVTAATSTADADLSLEVTDEDGQSLEASNNDAQGAMGKEVLSFIVDTPGLYVVLVALAEGGEAPRATVTVGGSFLAMPAFAAAPDADARPSGARPLEPGVTVQDTLGPGDMRDWYVVKVKTAGMLSFELTVPDGGEPMVEAFLPGRFGEAISLYEETEDGSELRPTLKLEVQAGASIYVRVEGWPCAYAIKATVSAND